MAYTTKFSTGLEDNPSAKVIREAVFLDEQSFTSEYDDIDPIATHVVVFADGVPAATGRLFQDETGYHIGRVAVAKPFRGKSLGALVMQLLEETAKGQHADKITLAAQLHAQGFYEKLGYIGYGDIFYDESCPHIAMEKQL